AAAVEKKIERLSTASLRRVIEPETDLPGAVAPGQLVADELLSVYGLPCFDSLTSEQKAQLSREELASIADLGVRFDAGLKAGLTDTVAVRQVAPRLIMDMFNMLIHPGVYESVGLPGWDTWRQVRRSPARVALRHEACRPILRELLDAGVLRTGRIPKAWRN